MGKPGRTGTEVSAYCLATTVIGRMGNPDHDDCVRMIHRALGAGINPDPHTDIEEAALVRAHHQLPPRGLWHRTAGVRNRPLATWLERDIAPLPADVHDPVGQQLLRRYLAAYGPTASSDLRAWCGPAGLPAAIRAARALVRRP